MMKHLISTVDSRRSINYEASISIHLQHRPQQKKQSARPPHPYPCTKFNDDEKCTCMYAYRIRRHRWDCLHFYDTSWRRTLCNLFPMKCAPKNVSEKLWFNMVFRPSIATLNISTNQRGYCARSDHFSNPLTWPTWSYNANKNACS